MTHQTVCDLLNGGLFSVSIVSAIVFRQGARVARAIAVNAG